MVDTVKSRDQLIHRAATNLGLVQPGEALSSEDAETLDNLVDPVFAQLEAEEIFFVDDTDAIDVKAFMPLASILANYAGPSFGSPINDQALARDRATLRLIASTRPTYVPLTMTPY